MNLELLESRLVPASVFRAVDLNGDNVVFRSSLGDLGGKISTTAAPDGVHNVFSVDLSDPNFAGTNFSVSVARAKGGDGRLIVGHINAGSNHLGTVKIAGDLGNIDAGSGSATEPAIKALTVDSFGRFDQRGTGNRTSFITGDLGTLVVKRDFNRSFLWVTRNLNSVNVGGSIIGGDLNDDGEIYASGDLGKARIGHDIRGGGGTYSGSVGAGHDVGSVTVGGSIYGGAGNNSGNVFAAYLSDAEIGSVRVRGSLVGGTGNMSGAVGGYPVDGLRPAVTLGSVTVGGDVIGGSGPHSGYVYAYRDTLQRLTVRGSLIGGSGVESGLVGATDDVGSVVIGGSVYGSSGQDSAEIYSGGGIRLLNIHGDVRGATGDFSGSIYCYAPGIETRIIGGALIPGTGYKSGAISIS